MSTNASARFILCRAAFRASLGDGSVLEYVDLVRRSSVDSVLFGPSIIHVDAGRIARSSQKPTSRPTGACDRAQSRSSLGAPRSARDEAGRQFIGPRVAPGNGRVACQPAPRPCKREQHPADVRRPIGHWRCCSDRLLFRHTRALTFHACRHHARPQYDASQLAVCVRVAHRGVARHRRSRCRKRRSSASIRIGRKSRTTGCSAK